MLRRLICSTLIILFFGCSVLLNAQSRAELPGDDKISQVLNNQFKDYNVFQFDTEDLLDQRTNDQLGFFTQLSIGDTYNWALALEPNKIKADNYRLSIASDAGDIDGITNNGIYTFGGIVHGTDHEVRLTVMEDFLYGYVETGDDAVFIEPLNYFVDGADKDLFVAYKASEIIKGAPLKCGVTEMQKRGKTIHQHQHSEKDHAQTRMPGNCFELEIAYANDFLMFQQFGSVAAVEAHVTGVLNNVQGNYDDEFSDEIQFLIVEIFVPTSAAADPFTTSTNSGTLLNDFTDWGPTGFSATHDLGALWSDRNFDGGTIGLAWVGVVCANFRYHILENFSSNANLLRVLHAHEMGHNFSFNHDPSGSATIMAPSVNSATTWSTQSQNEFDAYIPNVDPPNGCLVFCPPPVPPVAIFSPNYNVVCPGSFVTLFDQSINSPTSWSWNIPGGTPSSSTEKSPTVQFNNVGTYTISLTATNANGSNTSNGVVTVLANGGTDIFFYEGFESGAGQFTVQNPDGSDTWTNLTVQGTREGSKAMYVNNYNYNAQGEEDALISPVLDFTGRTNTELGIEYAYTRYNNSNKDSLKVYVSTNGGGTYTTIFANTENGNGNFGTVPQSTSEFIPSQETDWCFGTTFGPGCLNLDLSAYDGESNVVIKIANKNDWGNNMYVDNIRMTSSCVVQNPPIALFTAAPTSGCFPIVVFFNDQSTNSPSAWNWSFPGGTPASSSLQNPTVVYSNPGTYSVTLTAINAAGSDTETISGMIVVEGPPVASFTAVNNNGTVSFTNNSAGNNLSYQWTFGDGNGSASENPTHTYDDDGIYTVVLVVTSPCGTDVFEQTIFVESLPVAQFSALETDICAGEIVSFVDESTSNVISWDWSFPGGTPSSSSQENPQILYNTAGVFPVTLIVTSTLGNDTLVSNDFITVDPQPQAGFSSAIAGFDLTLTNNSLDATSYNWSFGDGGTSTASDPTYTYASDGAYTIELIASNSCGSDTITEDIVISSLPQGGFTSDVNIGCVPLTVNFLDISSANTTSWLWTFEGGTPATSSDQNPTIDYNSVGVFDVTLVATNANGSDTVSLADYVIVNDIPVSDFSFTITDQTITLTNQSTNADNYLWTFGDGNSDTATDVVYDYAADGFYTLVLVASNNCGSDTLTQEIEIATLPEAGFTSDSQGACLPVEIQFTDASSANTDSWLWTFEGGTPASSTDQNPLISYDAQGVYDVQLIVSNELGSDTLLFEDYIETFALPVPSFTASGSGLDIDFTNSSQFADTYYWDFGDTNSSTETDPSHTYGDVGAYSVTLYAINSCDTVSITELLNVNLGPQAIINSDLTEGCPDLTVAFDDGASPDVETWEWIFEGGNPSSSTDQQPTVTYSAPGSYDVQLIVGNTDGTDTLLLEDYITVFGLPEAGFTTVINNDEVVFTNTSINADTYEWQFGDGAISNETDPVYIYSSDGSYTVLLIAEGPCGIDSISQDVLIVTPPTADFTISVDSICEGSSVLFTNNSSSNSTSFNWSFEGGTPSTSTLENPEIFYSAPGQYDVSLIVGNAAGQDSMFLTDLIIVNPNPVAQFSASVNVGNLSTTNTSLNGLQYEWYFGDGGESNVFEPQYDYIEDGTYEILLIVSNTCGIDSFTQEVEIVLPPSADFEANSTNGCAPYEIEFSNLSSDNSDTYSWLFDGGTPSTSTTENPVVIYNNEGLFDVQLIVSNAVGSDTLNLEDYITIGLGVVADFEASVNGTEVNFTNTSNNGLTYFWDFGDNQTSNEENPVHTYGSDGVYTVTLSVTNDCETVDIQQEVIISVGAPIALFEFDQESFCTGADVEFFNLSSANAESYEWTFPGGQPSTSTEENPIVIYQNAGVYSATLIASNANGTGSYELVGEIIVYEAPIAGFDHTVSGFTVDFINNSQYGVSYSWDFGDGSDPSNIDTPSYLYSELGTYTVSLTVMNPCDTSVVENTVVIDETAPSAFFTAEPKSGCAPLEVDFIDLSTDNVTDWFWQFEGGVPETSTETNPSVVYENIGDFNVTLTVSNAVGSDVIQFSNYIEIGKGPEALFSYQNGALGGIQFINNSSDASSYTWNFGDGSTSSVISPLHFYDEAGVYAVELIATNECGSDTMIIELEYTPVSIDEIGELEALDIYPNPSSGSFEFNLRLKDQAERKLQVTLLDLLGRELEVKGYKVLNGTLNAGFDISDLPAGLYYLEFESEGEKTVERIIKI